MQRWIAVFTASIALAAGSSAHAQSGAGSDATPGEPLRIVEDTLVIDALIDLPLLIVANPGFGTALRIGKRDHRFQLGLSFQSGQLPDSSKGIFFDASVSTDALTVDWEYAIGFDVQMELLRFTGGATLGGGAVVARSHLGYEAWRVELNGEEVQVFNNFAAVAAGVQWFPLASAPVFVEATFGVIYLFGQDDAYSLAAESVELSSVGYNPWVLLGYRFE